MPSQRVTKLHPAARIAALASSFAVASMLLLPNAAFAAGTSIGSAAGKLTCVAGYDVVQTSSGGPSYKVPAGGGSITSWSTMAGGPGFTGQARLEVWRLKTGSTYTLVGISAAQTLTAGVLNTFTTNIKVQAGDLLGLQVVGPMLCLQPTTLASDTIAFSAVANTTPAVGGVQTMTSNYGPYTLDVAATVTATAPTGGCAKITNLKAKARCEAKARHDKRDKDKKDKHNQDKKGEADRSQNHQYGRFLE